MKRIYLSPPHMSGKELDYIREVFEQNWIAPIGPHLNKFEESVKEYSKASHAVAVSSCTAGLHLALKTLGVSDGDSVICSNLTFIGSVNPILYCNAKPIFIDSEFNSWNMDPVLLEKALLHYTSIGKKPKAILLVHIFGMCGNLDKIKNIATKFNIPIIEDAAESLGSTYNDKHTGTFGDIGVYSFNGNKLLTTSGGGIVITNNQSYASKIKFLSTQAKEPLPYYHHNEIGYNYRMSNVLAAIGVAQMEVLEKRIKATRKIHDYYKKHLSKHITFLEERESDRCNMWLTCGVLKDKNPKELIEELENHNIESRFIWKPMHTQPILKAYDYWEECDISSYIFKKGICLPSGSNMSKDDLDKIINILLNFFKTK